MFTLLVAVFLLSGCGMQVDVTKTAKGFSKSSNPNNVEILMMKPSSKDFTELASISVYRCKPSETARMHNALRAKSAELGADAVVIRSSGINENYYLWAIGSVIKYSE